MIGSIPPGDHLGIDIRFAAVNIAECFTVRGIDPKVIIKRLIAPAKPAFTS
jgi:hypothetical protein